MRVVVVDDHPVFLESVAKTIRERAEFELVGEAADAASALRLIRELQPDVAVLDLQLPDATGIEVAEAVRRSAVATRTLLLSAHHDPDAVCSAVAAGAAAYLSKTSTRRQICDTVAAVARGETVLDAQAQAGLAAGLRDRARPDPVGLSTREHEVLQLTAEGLSTRLVAARLGIGESTVKSHLKGVYAKLDVSDRAAAVAVAWRRGLLT